MRKIILLSLFLLSVAVSAQDSPEVISAENVSRLQSVAQVNFADINADFDTGWFILDDGGEHLAFHDVDGKIYVLDRNGTALDEIQYVRVVGEQTFVERVIIDMVFVPNTAFPFDYGLPDEEVYGSEAIFVLFDDYCAFAQGIGSARQSSACLATPNATYINLWLGNNSKLIEGGGIQSLWSEVQLDDGTYEIHENYVFYPYSPTDQVFVFPYVPAQDPEAVVRIGRIPPPYTVTSSLEGIVKLWNLQTGETLYEVDNGTGLPSVFGAINNPPTHLVWRDNANESLYLLDFETGENRLIDELNGDYAQWFFLGHDASVILAVNLGFEPNIVAWDVATGERTVLGEYRQCNRPQPDMARLSADGTSLVIGCDTGLDIWRIVD